MKKSYGQMSRLISGCFIGALIISAPVIAVQQIKTGVNLTKNNAVSKKKIFIQPPVQTTKPELRKTSLEDINSINLQGNVSITGNSKLITLSLRDTDIRQVLRMLADKAGLNIIIHDSVASGSKKVTLDLVNVTVNKAFEYVMTVNNLVYWMDNDTLIVATKSQASEVGLNNQQIKTIDVKYENAGKIANYLNKSIFALKQPNITTGNIASTNPSKNQVIIIGTQNDYNLAEKVVKKLDKEQDYTTFNVNHMSASQMAGLVCKNVFDTDSINVGDLPSGLGGGKLACSSKDVSNSETSGTFDSFKADGFSVMYYPDNGKVAIKGGTIEQVQLARNFVKENDLKQPQVYIELSIIQLTETGSKELSSTWAYYNNKIALDAGYGSTSTGKAWSGTSGTVGNTPISWYGRGLDGTLATQTGYLPGGFYSGKGDPLGSLANAGDIFNGYSKGIMNNLQFLISQSKGKVLANPRLIAKNNITSTINITDDYVSNASTTTTATTTTPVTNTVYTIGQLGLQISLKPTITPDGYVYLDLKPTYSVPGAKGGTAENSFTLKSQRDLDIKGVRVKDGETLILGGLVQEVESKESKKIPVLGDLPIVGTFFRTSSNTKSKNELIITVTPRIIKDSANETNI